MRLPSSLTRAPPPRLRVPMKSHDEKMGQVQDDQSRTSDEEESYLNTTTKSHTFCNTKIYLSSLYHDENAPVRSDEKMRGIQATNFIFLGENLLNKESSNLMDPTSENAIIPASVALPAMQNHSSSQTQTHFNDVEDDDADDPPTTCKNEILSGDFKLFMQRRTYRHHHPQTENGESSPTVLTSSSSQINSSLLLQKVKRRTLWWGNRGSGLPNYYATMCLLFWMLACYSGVHLTEAITTSGTTGEFINIFKCEF